MMDFEASAREIVKVWGNSTDSFDALASSIAAALAEAVAVDRRKLEALKADLDRLSSRETEHVSRIEELEAPAGAHERVVARLRDWFRDPTYGNFEFVDFQAIMIDAGLAPRSSCNCFLYDQQACDICQGIAKDPQNLRDRVSAYSIRARTQ